MKKKEHHQKFLGKKEHSKMRFLKKFESIDDYIKEDFFKAMFNLIEEKVGNLFDIFTEVSDEYEIDLKISISIYYDPWRTTMWPGPIYDDISLDWTDDEYVMKVNDQMEIFDKGNVEFIDWHFTIKNFDLIDESLIYYQLNISTNYRESEWLEDVVHGRNKYIDRVSNMYDFYRISTRSSYFDNGITKELRILCKID